MLIYEEAKRELEKQRERESRVTYRILIPLFLPVLKTVGLIIVLLMYAGVGLFIHTIIELYSPEVADFFILGALIGAYFVYRKYWNYVSRSFAEEFNDIQLNISGIEESYQSLLAMRPKPRILSDKITYYDTLARYLREKGNHEESEKLFELLRKTVEKEETSGVQLTVLNVRYAVYEDKRKYFLLDRRPDYRGILFFPVQWLFPRKIYPIRRYQYEELISQHKKQVKSHYLNIKGGEITSAILGILLGIAFLAITLVLAWFLIYTGAFLVYLIDPLTSGFTTMEFLMAVFWTFVLAGFIMEYVYYSRKKKMEQIEIKERLLSLEDSQHVKMYPEKIQFETVKIILIQLLFPIIGLLMLHLKLDENVNVSFIYIFVLAIFIMISPLGAYAESEKYTIEKKEPYQWN